MQYVEAHFTAVAEPAVIQVPSTFTPIVKLSFGSKLYV